MKATTLFLKTTSFVSVFIFIYCLIPPLVLAQKQNNVNLDSLYVRIANAKNTIDMMRIETDLEKVSLTGQLDEIEFNKLNKKFEEKRAEIRKKEDVSDGDSRNVLQRYVNEGNSISDEKLILKVSEKLSEEIKSNNGNFSKSTLTIITKVEVLDFLINKTNNKSIKQLYELLKNAFELSGNIFNPEYYKFEKFKLFQEQLKDIIEKPGR